MKSKVFIFARRFFLIILFIFFSCSKYLNSQQSREEIKSRIDIVPDASQVPYSPADGSTVKANPPPFTWVPVKKDITYQKSKYIDKYQIRHTIIARRVMYFV